MPYARIEDRRRAKRESARRRRAAKRAARPSPAPPSWESLADPAGAVVAWAAATLKVPTGPLRGQPFRIVDWQEDFLRDALAPGVREAGLSVSRKNGKSGVIAALLLAYLAGPLARPEWRGIVTSMTGELAKELRHAIELTAATANLPIQVYRSPTPGRVEGLHGARVDILAADKATGNAVGADIALIDEAGLLDESKRDLWNAVLSSISGRDGRLMCISIRGDGPMFRELGERAADPAVVWHEYAAPADCELDDRQAWARANPGLEFGIKSESYMADMARRALASPADQRSFRSFDMNQPVDPGRTMIVSTTDWRACITAELPPREGRCVIGFDLGGSSSMTALVALWPRTGRMEAWGAFPDTPDLLARGAADGVGGLYEQMHERGEFAVYPGRVTPVAEFLRDCAARLAGSRVLAAGADRYRQAEAIQALDSAGLRWPMTWRGQGASATADGSHDVIAFQRRVLGRRLACAPSLLMASAISESSIRFDASGNPALEKGRARGRIDALASAVIACGLAAIHEGKPRRRRFYAGFAE